MLLLVLLACETPDDPLPGVLDTPEDSDAPADADGDGFVAADDCDDTDAAVFPDAVEACDGVDADCDGEDCLVADREIARLRGDTEEAGLGYGLAFGEGDDGLVLAVGAPAQDSDGAGIVYLWSGPFDGTVGVGQADAFAGGEESSAGLGLAAVPDVDGDGNDELVVLGFETGWLLPLGGGGLDGARATFPVRGDAGWACAGTDDVTGDGVADFAVSTWHDIDVFDGAVEGDLTDEDAAAHVEDAWVIGAPGDTDGDGLADLVVGTSVTGEGAWLYRGPIAGTLERDDADARLLVGANGLPGWQVGPAGDVSGDGEPDILVSGLQEAWVLPGDRDGNVGGGDAIVSMDIDPAGPRLLADLDGDGAPDFVYSGGLDGDAGGVGILWGPLTGAQVALDQGADWWPGESDEDAVGYWLAAGDTDGDGADELALGAAGRADGAGAVYLLAF